MTSPLTPRPERKKTTILVVDDQADNRELLVTLLGYAGFRVTTAASGVEGLQSIRTDPPALVISDVVMPGMDGFEFIRRLRTEAAAAPLAVIFYTAAYYEHEARTLAAKVGVAHILTKPADPEVILRVVNEALRIETPAPVVPAEQFEREHAQLVGDKLLQKVEELEASNRRLNTLVAIGRELTSERELARVFARCIDDGCLLLGARYGVIRMAGPDGESLRHLKTSGYDPDTLARIQFGDSGSTLLQRVLAESQAVRLAGLRPDPHGKSLPLNHPPVDSFLGVPLATPGGLYGVMYFTAKIGAAEFSAQDEQIAVLLGSHVSVVYENVLRFDEIQRHAAMLEQRVAERTEALTRSNQELEQFAYVASHDLQEPLRKIVGFTGLLAQKYADTQDAETVEFAGYVVDGAKRMQALIQDLLIYSRVGRENMALAPVDLASVLSDALVNLQASIEEAAAVVTHDPLPTVAANASQLGQVFQNLLGNAIKFRGTRTPVVHVGAVQRGGEWELAVRDNGIGLDPKYADRIFKVFQRLHRREEYPGTGIGLAICKKVVERHGGRIWLESQPGQGTAFFFTLPMLQETP